MRTTLLFLAALLAGSACAQGAWTLQTSGTAPLGYSMTPSIRFFGTEKGWVLTPQSRLLRTLDGGKTWTQTSSPDSTVNSLSFINADTGWVAAGTGALFITTDGAATWTQQVRGGGGV